RLAARDGRVLVSVPEPDWRRAFGRPEARLTVRWRARPDDFRLPPRTQYPVIRLVSAVITRLEEPALAPGDPRAALVHRPGLRAALVARGYAHHEPLFTLFFLAADFLPFVRLSPRGVWDVKQGRVLLPRRARRP